MNVRLSVASLLLFVLCPAIAVAENSPDPPLADPTIVLIRDPTVRDAVECTTEQRKSVDEVLEKHNGVLLAIRDVSPSGADESAQRALAEIRTTLNELLTKEQKFRLQGITLQAQGYDALLRHDLIDALDLTNEQQTRLREISVEFYRDAREVRKATGDQRADELTRLQAERHKQVVDVLDDRQETQLGKLLGEPFDFAKVVKSPAQAPEFVGIEEWINSEPLTMRQLRGKVVVVHFFAFGCSNCINNYPWYREWHADFHGEDVALIGIHTPETDAETDNGRLRESLKQHQPNFPVAVDKEKRMWAAWYNGIWPSVYIVDRQGRLRYWWYGELNWQEAGNQRVARRQINDLVAETTASKPGG